MTMIIINPTLNSILTLFGEEKKRKKEREERKYPLVRCAKKMKEIEGR